MGKIQAQYSKYMIYLMAMLFQGLYCVSFTLCFHHVCPQHMRHVIGLAEITGDSYTLLSLVCKTELTMCFLNDILEG